MADIDEEANNDVVNEKTFEIESDFQHINFDSLEHAIIHFELEGTNYLKDNILKFGFMLMIHMWSLMLKILTISRFSPMVRR